MLKRLFFTKLPLFRSVTSTRYRFPERDILILVISKHKFGRIICIYIYIYLRGVFKQNVVDVISWAAEGFRRRP